jgi:PAS domain S-box-containing protein
VRDKRHSDAYLAAIVDSSDDAILSKDLNGIIQSCNASAERLFGYSASELIGKPVRMLIPTDRQSEEDEILARIRRGERVEHFETIRLTRSGQPIEISLTISPVRDEDGTIIGASKIARSIADKRRASIAQSYLAAIVESSDDAIISKNLNGIIQSANAAAVRLFGYTTAELVGKSVRILIPAERQAEEDDILSRIRRGERVDHFETVRVTKAGERREISLSVSPVRDASGAIVGVSKIARDITDQRRAMRELAAQQEWFRVTLSSIGDAVIAADVDGRVNYMNTVAERLTGWTLPEATGQPLGSVFRIVNEATRAAVESPWALVMRSGQTVGLANHTILCARNGTEVPIDDSGAPIRDRDGRIIGVVLVFRDVTERRRRDAERRAETAERDRLLESERAARAEAERASRVKDDFVAMVSHELRTPLNAILGWTELMMRNGSDPAMMTRGLEVVARNTRVQAQLISDLLDISRISSGKLRLDFQAVDLATIIDDALDTVQHTADAKQIAIRRHVDRSVGAVAGDPARLQQIIWNLVSNAIKFTPEGGRVDVALRGGETSAEITIADSGVGIAPEFLPHVFERFQQADGTMTRRYGGLGLGLTIVKHLVERHGGTVSASSEGEGRGATFVIVLPSAALSRAQARTHDRSTAPASRVALDGVRILVVEDEPDTRTFLTQLLRANGAEVVEAGTAADALEVFPSAIPDILLSDIGLPQVDGYDLIRRIRQLGVTAGGGLPAIALTAYVSSEDRTRALRAGYQTHLAKPVEPAELLATVASFAALVKRT